VRWWDAGDRAIPIPVAILVRLILEPQAGDYTRVDVAGYIVDLASAGEDCRDRLARVRTLQSTPPRGHP
jgi:hypothetical protein